MSKERPIVLLTNPIHQLAHERLARHANVLVAPAVDAASLNHAVANVDGLIVRAQLPDDIFQHQRRLKGVVRHGVGLDMIPVEHATRAGIPVSNLPGSNTASVVEYCLSMMLHFCRPMDELVITPDVSEWDTRRARASTVRELNGLTLGIVGVGTIGKQLARIALALGMKVLGVTRSGANVPTGVEAVDKHTAFSQAHIIVLACPLTAETRGLVDDATLNIMRSDAILINVARGPVVVRDALLGRLRSGQLAGAALDVHDEQPIAAHTYPTDLPGLELTPHIAGITETSMRRMSENAVDEMLRLLRGEEFKNLVNPAFRNHA